MANDVHDPVSYRYASDKIGFYIAANDQEILTQVNRLMTRSGFVGIMDTAGRLQYLVDGRRGTPHAARRIIETTGRIIRDRQDTIDPLLLMLSPAADKVLAMHHIRQELKGCRFLRYLLLHAGLNETLLRPISKTLYPAVASHFKVNIYQVERDIRYALKPTDFRQAGLTTTAAISRMYDEMIRLAESMQKKEKPSCILTDEEGLHGHDTLPAAENSHNLAE